MANQFTVKVWDGENKWCSKCGFYSEKDRFYFTKRGFSTYCIEHTKQASRANHHRRQDEVHYKRTRKDTWAKQRYGLTLLEYEAKLEAQNSLCAICFKDISGFREAHLDHNHTTGKLRAFLCTNCNRGIGHLQEDMDIMQSAMNYISEHSV